MKLWFLPYCPHICPLLFLYVWTLARTFECVLAQYPALDIAFFPVVEHRFQPVSLLAEHPNLIPSYQILWSPVREVGMIVQVRLAQYPGGDGFLFELGFILRESYPSFYGSFGLVGILVYKFVARR